MCLNGYVMHENVIKDGVPMEVRHLFSALNFDVYSVDFLYE